MKWDIIHYSKACFDLLLPRTCVVCGRKLLTDEKHLCLHCAVDLPLTLYWERPHNPMADRFNKLLQDSLEQKWRDERYAFACPLMFYDSEGAYRQIPYSIKYKGNIPVGRHFGKMLGNMLSHAAHFEDVDMVIPVPLHWTRRWKRGYNQAEVLAEAIAREMGVVMRTDVLKRDKRTATQTRLEIEEKARNVAGAFEVSEQFVRLVCSADKDAVLNCSDAEASSSSGTNMPRHILLVDDIFTTGSTLLACFNALREVFPPSVRISVATLGFVGE